MALEVRRSGQRSQLLAESTLIGNAAKQVLTDHSWDAQTVSQISDMVTLAVERALQRFRKPVPARADTFEAGGKYRFLGPVDASPPAHDGFTPKDDEPAEEAILDEPQPERNGDDEVPWLLT